MKVHIFMTVLLIALIVGLTGYFILQKMRKTLPITAFVAFDSMNEIMTYYKSAISIILKKKKLFLLPLCFALSFYLISIPMWLHQRSTVASLDRVLESTDFFNTDRFYSIKTFLLICLEKFFLIPQYFDYGYVGVFVGNQLILLIFLICLFLYRIVSRKLKKYAVESNLDNVLFLEKILKSSLIVVIASALLLLLTRTYIGMTILISELALAIINLSVLSIVSIIEGFILFTVRGIIIGEEQSFKTALNQSLNILRPLFNLNLLLAVIGYLPHIIIYPNTLGAFLADGLGLQGFHSPFLSGLSSYSFYFNSLITGFTVCAPFVLLKNKGKVIETLKSNFGFIGDHFVKYIIFIVIGIIILFTPSLLLLIVGNFVHSLSYYKIILDISVTTIRIALAVLFYIALFKFFHYYYTKEAAT